MRSLAAVRRITVTAAAVAAVGLAAAVVAEAATAGAAASHDHPAAPAVSSAGSAASTASAANVASAADGPASAARRPSVPAVALERRDPLEVVRERLARRLGAVPPSGGEANVVRLVTQAGASSGTGTGTGTASAVGSRTVREVHHRSAPAAHASVAREPRMADAPGSWNYADGRTGPLAWSRLDPAYARCAAGTRQSPIDIRGSVKVELDPVRFDYRPGAFRVLDTGHTVQVNLAPGSSIEIGERRYELLQFHFHRPSEERIDGRQFAMAAHLVHRSADGRLAVVAVLLEPGAAQPLVQAVWNNLPLERGEEAAARAPLDPSDLLPADRRYATYMGSLTEPPCTEGVLWVVIRQPIGMTPEQEAVFAHLYPMNARPLQAAAGRLIKESN